LEFLLGVALILPHTILACDCLGAVGFAYTGKNLPELTYIILIFLYLSRNNITGSDQYTEHCFLAQYRQTYFLLFLQAMLLI
jgi:hypothetical protein